MASNSSTVVPLAYSLKSTARRFGCSQQMLRDMVTDDEMPGYMKDGELRIPRGYVTGYDSRYNTNLAWVDVLLQA